VNRKKCWEALHQRSESEIEVARQGLARALERVDQLESQRSRLVAMRDDYQAKLLASEQQAGAMSRSVAYRGFLAQIGALMLRVSADLDAARAVTAGARRELLRCEQSRSKYQMLVDREVALELEREDAAEGRMLEEFAVSRFVINRRAV
jgi:flagellar export protein FliJ